MKHLFTLILLLAFGLGMGQAQPVKRYLLLEHFTNSNCGTCAFRNPSFRNLIENYPDDVHHVSIHPSFPYLSCVFYQANTADNSARVNFYPDLFGTPTVYLNGEKADGGSTLISQGMLENALDQTSPLQVTVEETDNGSSRDVEVNVISADAPPSGNLRLFVMVVEKLVEQTTGNGESEHHNVFRRFLSPSDGVAISPAAAGGSVNATYSFDLEASWEADEIYVLAFVQDVDTREVINSGTRFDPTVTTTQGPGLVDLNVQVFPNPANDHLQLQSGVPLSGELQLFNAQGVVVKSRTLTGQQLVQMDIRDLSPGMYILSVLQEGGQRIYEKVVKK